MDDESKKVPLAFANQVIKMFGDHLLGDKARFNLRAYRVIRVVFRQLGGSWFALCQGDPRHTQMLLAAIKAWGRRKQ